MNIEHKLLQVQRKLSSRYAESNNHEVCDLCKTLMDIVEVLEEMNSKFGRLTNALTDDGK